MRPLLRMTRLLHNNRPSIDLECVNACCTYAGPTPIVQVPLLMIRLNSNALVLLATVLRLSSPVYMFQTTCKNYRKSSTLLTESRPIHVELSWAKQWHGMVVNHSSNPNSYDFFPQPEFHQILSMENVSHLPLIRLQS